MSTYIFESKRIDAILDFIDLDSFFIFDVDHTLIEPPQVIGSTYWEKHFMRRLIDQGFESVIASKKAQTLWKEIQKSTNVQIVDQEVLNLISYLKSRNIPILGLTSRDKAIVDLTFKQLESVQLHDIFSFQNPCRCFGIQPDCYFSKGMVFCGDNPKDLGLRLLLDYIQFKPKKIIFVDDQKSHLYELEEMAYQSNIHYVGMHYTASTHEKFNFEIARVQERFLPKIISDDEALQLIEKNP